MSDLAYGELRADGVRFERLYDATAEELWSAITDPDQLPSWLTNASRYQIEPGGAIELDFGGGETASGRVVELEPGRVLAFTWTAPNDPNESLVRFEIIPREHGVLLILEHSKVGREVLAGYAAGWHAHLDALAGAISSESTRTRYRELRPEYERRLTT